MSVFIINPIAYICFMTKLIPAFSFLVRVCMTVDSNTSSGRGNDPEQIDLIDLLLQLWRGKMTILVAVIIAILLAVGYLMIAKENGHLRRLLLNPMPRRLLPILMRSTSYMVGMRPKSLESSGIL